MLLKLEQLYTTKDLVNYLKQYSGAKDRAGFIEAFVIGPANMASNKTTAPIAIPAIIPVSLLPVDTLMITTIKKKVNNSSKTKALQTSIVGIVAPKNSLVGNRNNKIKLAANCT